MGTINKKLKDISPIAVETEAGNAGRVVYDLKTGVLKLEKELVSLPGSKMPLNLKLYYDVTHGGWRLNYEQYLTQKSQITAWESGTDKPDVIYTDGKMEDRYFYAANQVVHESSLSDADASDYGYFENETCLNIKQTSTGWELEDLSGNVMSFDGNGKLCSVENVYGHTSSVTSATITDGEGNVCTFVRSNGGMTVEIRGYNKRFELLPVTVSGSSGWYMLAEYKAEWDSSGAVLQKSCTDRSFYRLQNNSLACVYDGFTSVEATYSNNKPSVLEKKEYRDYGASVSGEIWTLSLANGETTEKYTDFTHTADNRYSYKDKKGIKTEYGLVRYDSNHPDLLKYASITVDGLCKAPDRTVTSNYLVESYVPNLGTVTDFTTISVEDEITRLDLDYDTSAITNKNGLSIALFNLLSSQELLNMFLGMKKGTRIISVYMNAYCYDEGAMPLKFRGYELKNLAPVVCTDFQDEDGNSRYKTYTVYQVDFFGITPYALKETTQLVKGNKRYVSYKYYNSKFELVKEKGYDGVEKQYTYDADGLMTGERAGSDTAYVKTDYAFEQKTEAGEKVYEEKSTFYVDGQERSARNIYDGKKELKYTEDAKGNKTTPVFANDLLTSIKVNGTEKTSYEYENNRLTKLTHNGTRFRFGYGLGYLGSIGYETLNTPNNNKIEFNTLTRSATDDEKTVQYDTDVNGYVERYTYDKNGRLLGKKEKKAGTSSYASVIENTYLEAEDGGLKPSVLEEIVDNKAGLKYTYTYDKNRKHATKVTVTNTAGGAQKYVKNISYDGYDRVTTENYGNIAYMVTREDGNESPDGKIRTASTTALPNEQESIYSYDKLNRRTQKQTIYNYWSTYPIRGTSQHIFYQTYDYHAGKSGTNETTGLVKSEKFYPQSSATPTEQYEYTYDANGNVTEIKNVFDTGKNISYEYDSLNRLTKETNLAIGSEWRYTYDNGGNITRKEEYNPSTGALVSSRDYGYGDSYWKDQLTSWGSYGTSSFAYDSSGNPTKYKDSTLTWEGKRPVKYAESDTKYTDLSYDGNGLLTGIMQVQNFEIWGGAVATNVYSREMTRDGDRILSEKVTNIDGTLLTNEVKNIKYCYDADGICGMFVDGSQYFFRRNIFGDVTEIYDKNGVKKAEYAYDAWGTCHLMLDTDGVGSLNPFRYRGYYMVSCIGLYYLTTRFYDYTTGRFLNADVPSICFDDGLTLPEGCNLYSYCHNNPISYVDPTGHFALIIGILLMTTMIGGTIGGIVSHSNGKSGWDLVGDIILGAMIGLAAGGLMIATIGAIAYGIFGATTTVLGGVAASKAFALGAAVYNSVAFGIAPLYGIAMQGIEFEQGKNPVQSPQLVPPHPYGKVDVYNDFINNLKLIK